MASQTPTRVDLPVLPLRNVVVYPHMVIPLFVGRDKSIRALEQVMQGDKQILLIAQKSEDTEEPGADDLYEVGTLSQVLQLLKLPDGTIKVLVEGTARVRIRAFAEHAGVMTAQGEVQEPELSNAPREMEVTARSLVAQFEQYLKTNRKLPPELLATVNGIDDPGRLADTIAAHVGVRLAERNQIGHLRTETYRLDSYKQVAL